MVVSVIEQQIRAWLENFVVGLNLCPFAAPVVTSDGLRIKICESTDLEQIMQTFLIELNLIQSTSELDIATTLLVIPNALGDFEDYLDVVDIAETLLIDAGLEGVIQLASFHPQYQFAEEPVESASHFSNRSPYPLIHFLREDMMASEMFRIALGSSRFTTEVEVKELAQILEQSVDIDFIKLDSNQLKSQIVNSADELNEYYENNQIMFFSEESRSFDYFLLAADDYNERRCSSDHRGCLS